MVQFLKLVSYLALMISLSACKIVNSVPVFDEGRLFVSELNALEGVYGSPKSLLEVSRASQVTDLLNWRLTANDTGDEIAYGQAVVSQVPQSAIYLVLLLDMTVLTDPDNVVPTSVVFIRRPAHDVFYKLPNNEGSVFSQIVDANSEPIAQARNILRYASANLAAFAEQDGEGFVLMDPADYYLYPWLDAPPTAQSTPDNSQCLSQVRSRLLYCRETSDLNSGGIVYVVDCPGGSRSAKRECRGWFSESSFSSGIDPYYCDPQTDVKGPTPESVVEQVCR